MQKLSCFSYCFIDVKGTFDNTDFEVIDRAMRKREVEGLANRRTLTILKSSIVETKVCGSNSRMGGILSPTCCWCS